MSAHIPVDDALAMLGAGATLQEMADWLISKQTSQPSPSEHAAHCPVKHCGMTYARVPSDGRCHACGAPVRPSLSGQGWPFVESPADFAERMVQALRKFDMLGAVRHVLIENPPALAARQPEVK